MRLARPPLHANPIPGGLDRANSPDAAIRHANAITYSEATGHRSTSTVQHVAIQRQSVGHFTLHNCANSCNPRSVTRSRLLDRVI
jgi:hypothetical protein